MLNLTNYKIFFTMKKIIIIENGLYSKNVYKGYGVFNYL